MLGWVIQHIEVKVRMKIYIVTSGDYSTYGINAVFTTRQAAEDYVEIWNRASSDTDWASIEEWTADAANSKFLVYRVNYGPSVSRGQDGGISWTRESSMNRAPMMVTDQAPVPAFIETRADGRVYGHAEGYSYEQAEKALYDALAQHKASEAGI